MGIALALQYLGGHPFFVFMSLFACLFLRPRYPFKTIAVAGAVSLGLTALQLGPAIELFSVSMRSGVLVGDQVFANSVSPDALWGMLAPFWNRSSDAFTGDPSITSFYVGVPAALLAVWGGFTPGRTKTPVAWVVIGGTLALGAATPVYPALLKLVPGLGLFRFPAQWLWLATIGIALLAGKGVSRIRSGRSLALLLVLADLWVFMGQSPNFRTSPAFYSLRPQSIAQNQIGADQRVAHTKRFLRHQARLEEKDEVTSWEDYWIGVNEALTPSRGRVFRVREVTSDAVYAPRDVQELVSEALGRGPVPSDLPLLRFLGVKAVFDMTEDGRTRVLPIKDPRPRVTWIPKDDPSPEDSPPIRTSETPTRMTVSLGSTGPGYVVWADTFFSGWRAYVDGQRVPLVRTNRAFRGISVPEGSRQVVFRYVSIPFLLGLGLFVFMITFLVRSALRIFSH